MPHQCLACGTIIPSGSQDILKGCSNCGGKKFFYITQPVSNEEREDILSKVEKEREKLLSKEENLEGYVKEFLTKMQEKEEEKDFLSDQDIENMFQQAWLKVKEKDPEAKKAKKDDADWFKKYLEPPKVQIVRDIPKDKKDHKDKEKYKDKVKDAKGKKKDAKGKKKGGKGKSPDVIKVIETGVYEINIEALMDNEPIIVQQDGTYLINLDSVFEKLGDKKKKKKSRKKRR